MGSINIPEDIQIKLQKRVDSTEEFASVEEYVLFVLKQVVEKLEAKPAITQDEEKIKERLRSLGYLD